MVPRRGRRRRLRPVWLRDRRQTGESASVERISESQYCRLAARMGETQAAFPGSNSPGPDMDTTGAPRWSFSRRAGVADGGINARLRCRHRLERRGANAGCHAVCSRPGGGAGKGIREGGDGFCHGAQRVLVRIRLRRVVICPLLVCAESPGHVRGRDARVTGREGGHEVSGFFPSLGECRGSTPLAPSDFQSQQRLHSWQSRLIFYHVRQRNNIGDYRALRRAL